MPRSIRFAAVLGAAAAVMAGPVLVAPWAWTAAAAPSVPVTPSNPTPSAAGAMGVIRGRVIDRTAREHPVAGQRVRLQIVERAASSERETRTDARGAFAFMGLPVGGLRIFLLTTEYAGVVYEAAHRIVLTSEAPGQDLTLSVYDPGGDRRALRGALLFAVVDVAPGALRVTTVQQLLNPGDRTVVTNSTEPLEFPVPKDAVAVQTLDGWRAPHTGSGRITDTPAITPGTAQVTYAYQERLRRNEADLTWMPPFGAGRVEILVADAHVRVDAPGLRQADPVTASGRRYRHWSGGPVGSGGSVTVHVTGVPSGAERWPGMLAGALAMALGAGLVIAVRRH